MYATSLFCPENTVSLKLAYTNPYPHCGTPIYNDHGKDKYVHWCKSALNVMGIINYFFNWIQSILHEIDSILDIVFFGQELGPYASLSLGENLVQ